MDGLIYIKIPERVMEVCLDPLGEEHEGHRGDDTGQRQQDKLPAVKDAQDAGCRGAPRRP